MKYLLTKIIFLLLCLCISNVKAEDANQFELLSNIACEVNNEGTNEAFIAGNISLLGDENLQTMHTNSTRSVRVYANYVSIVNTNGYTFHVADYYGAYGHSRIVTCLDGSMKGLQGISDNGILTIESRNVQWFKNYFIHYYPSAKITSFENNQVFELF